MEKVNGSSNKFKENIAKWRAQLSAPTDPIVLGLFRICFGVLMLFYIFKYRSPAIIQSIYLSSDFHFSYPLVNWLPFPDPSLQTFSYLLGIMAVAAAFITLGLFYRYALVTFLLSFGYMFLLEKTYYNNHYYFIVLLTILFLFTGGDRFAALDQKIFPKNKKKYIPYWHLFLFQIQVCIVYFFGGIAKLNPDWIGGHITQIIFEGASDGFIFLSAFISLLIDLALGFLLMMPSTRRGAIMIALVFHLVIKLTLNIGVFPYLMMTTCILFIDPKDIHKKVGLSFIKKRSEKFHLPDIRQIKPLSNTTWVLICLFLVIQVVLPFRHMVYKGSVSWNQLGDRFAWRMFAHENYGHIDFFVTDIITGETIEVPRLKGINAASYVKMAHMPDMVLQYARYLHDEYKRQGIYNPIVTVNSFVSKNGRPFSLFINSEINLAHPSVSVFQQDLILDDPIKWTTTKILPSNVGWFFSPEYQLAVIDREGYIPGDDPDVERFKRLIDEFIGTEEISGYQVSNLVVDLKDNLDVEYGRQYSAEDILIKISAYFPSVSTLPTKKQLIPLFI